ncbi:MAG TPA: ATP-binding cassette domain-containing protein [Acidimicrobiales bacterium]|nr:ATP-binding cassette domain-containing protein [Acidimicrobiales bacterium]
MQPIASPGPGDGSAGGTGTPPLLDVRGVSKRFGTLQVLDDVSLTVDAGEVVALVGDNGAGKSTLVRCIARATAADAGAIAVGGEPVGPGQDDAVTAGIAVVWQDLALCDNLDTVANLFLGNEDRRVLLGGPERQVEARRLLARLGIDVPDLTRPVAALSGGQRQAIAVARALDADPRLLVLDEPTASLGRTETDRVLRLVDEVRRDGTAVLLVTHQLDHVFELADRIVVLRQGRIVGAVSPVSVHPDDVIAMQLGVEVDSTASRQLRRLGSLVEQLSEVEPAASLPLVVSSMAAALGEERLCVHLLDDRAPEPVLSRSAAVALPEALLAVNAELPMGPAGGPVGLAAQTATTVVTDDVRTDPAWRPFRAAAAEAGVLSGWAAPITGVTGVLGAISGYGDTVGRPRSDQLALISLYANHAAASIERERMYVEARRRNRVLEAIHTVLEALAGPQQVHAGLDGALVALCDVLGAEEAVIRVAVDGRPETRSAVGLTRDPAHATATDPLVRTADAALAGGRAARVADPRPGAAGGPGDGPGDGTGDPAGEAAGRTADTTADGAGDRAGEAAGGWIRGADHGAAGTGDGTNDTAGEPGRGASDRTGRVADGTDDGPGGASAGVVVAVPFRAPAGDAALAVRWARADRADDGVEVLHDAARSMSLALEREQLEAAHREAQALRRSQRLQREFLSRLSHELRTPLTAIHGCVDTLRQPDVEWARPEQDRFLHTIATESDRMRRLVADLFDVSALDAGIFRLNPDWCDLRLVIAASVACAVPAAAGGVERVAIQVADDLGPVWADHQRVEQVLVNLLENAVRHAPPDSRVRVAAGPAPGGRAVEVRIADDGDGVDPELATTLFDPRVAGPRTGGTGLGLAIARGIARAHGGDLTLERPGPDPVEPAFAADPMDPAGSSTDPAGSAAAAEPADPAGRSTDAAEHGRGPDPDPVDPGQARRGGTTFLVTLPIDPAPGGARG